MKNEFNDNCLNLIGFICFLLGILFIILGFVSKVNASTINTDTFNGRIEPSNGISHSSKYSYYSITQNLYSLPVIVNFDFRSPISWNGNIIEGQYFAYNINVNNTTSGQINFNDINLNITCSNYRTNNSASRSTITYQDGTTATITNSGIVQDVCSRYVEDNTNEYNSISGNISITDNSVIDLHPLLLISLYNDDEIIACETNANGSFKCPIKSNEDYFGFSITLFNSGISSNYRFGIMDDFLFYYSDLSEISNNLNLIQSLVDSVSYQQITNQIQNQQQNLETQNKIDNIDNTLKDDNIDSPTSSTDEWSSMNASNGTITNLLTLPIQLMHGYVNGMSSSCTPFNLGSLFNHEIILPCINIGSLIGSALWTTIDILFSGFMIFGIAKKLIKIFNDFTNMKSNQIDELYGGGA